VALAALGASRAAAQDRTCGLEPMNLADVQRVTPAQMDFALRDPAVAGAGFDIVLVPGPALQNNPAMLAALERAAARWESFITDPITVTIDVDMAMLGNTTIASTSSRFLGLDLATLLAIFADDAGDEPADVAAQRLEELAASSLPFVFPDGVVYGGEVVFTKANIKAALDDSEGLDAMFEASDGTITFNTIFPFDFDNRDGVGFGLRDFETTAIHEIGHALGFTSFVDTFDATPPPAEGAVLALDLFRFAGDPGGLPDATDFGVRSREMRARVEVKFDDIDHEFRLATGRNGDGNNTSHWKANELTGIRIGVMDPTLATREVIPISAADLRVLDVLGYEIAAGDAPPEVSILTDGAVAGPTVVVPANQTIQFGTQSSDGDGLGFPVFARQGLPALVTQLWDFGGLAPKNGPLAILSPGPQVSFDLPAGSPSRTFPVSLTAFDALGDSTTQSVSVVASEPPTVSFGAGGELVAPRSPSTPTPTFRSGQPVELQALAADSDGLGFPVFASLGFSTPISFLWDFGGGRAASPLAIFVERPVVTFDLDPGQDSQSFTVSLTAFDALGLRRTASGSVTVVRSGPPIVSIVFDGLTLGSIESLAVPAASLRGRAVQLGSDVFDEDGLGFPAFADLGITAPVSYLWDFGGGESSGPLAIFTPNPVVTFPVAQDETPSFNISLTVFDATGQSTKRSLLLRTVPGGETPPTPQAPLPAP
jgi:hypothetical protein